MPSLIVILGAYIYECVKHIMNHAKFC